jgi:hypothetical protein
MIFQLTYPVHEIELFVPTEFATLLEIGLPVIVTPDQPTIEEVAFLSVKQPQFLIYAVTRQMGIQDQHLR